MIDFNPHPVRRADLDCPDELRVDLDPQPGVRWNTVRQVAMCVKEVLEDHGLVGYPKTSGSRGIHVNVRIKPDWDYVEVRRAALALAREVERRVPKKATSKWWKEERHGVFVDYNQNARDRTIASGYSVRPVPDAKVCCPITWREVPDVEPGDLRLDTVPARLKKRKRPRRRHRQEAGSLDKLLDLAAPRRGGGPRRRPVAAPLPQAARRAEAGAAEQGQEEELDLGAVGAEAPGIALGVDGPSSRASPYSSSSQRDHYLGAGLGGALVMQRRGRPRPGRRYTLPISDTGLLGELAGVLRSRPSRSPLRS